MRQPLSALLPHVALIGSARARDDALKSEWSHQEPAGERWSALHPVLRHENQDSGARQSRLFGVVQLPGVCLKRRMSAVFGVWRMTSHFEILLMDLCGRLESLSKCPEH